MLLLTAIPPKGFGAMSSGLRRRRRRSEAPPVARVILLIEEDASRDYANATSCACFCKPLVAEFARDTFVSMAGNHVLERRRSM